MSLTYRDAGVDIDAGAKAVALMRAAVQATHGPEVLAGVGAFGGLFACDALQDLVGPVLVASTDGVGTKTKIAAATGRFGTIGHDIVNHCANDILVQGARPLFFLDYIAASKLDPQMVAAVVSGAADACKALGCALLGGETAEMPGVYQPGEFDLVGTIVGWVDRPSVIDGSRIAPGDTVLGLPSSGLHTNGYSLARRVLGDLDLATKVDELGEKTLGEVLLAPHRAYVREFDALRAAAVPIHGMAHITGGGLYDNPPRILPDGAAILLETCSWDVPPILQLIQRLGSISHFEMAHTFNMGLGMLLILPSAHADAALALLPHARIVGRVTHRKSAPVEILE